MDFAAARKVMVDSQVRVNDVTDRELQAALGVVARERFCAPDRAFSAYAEVEAPIAGDRRLMLPRDLSKLLQAAEGQRGERALAIAAPYAAAVLAQMGLDVTAQESEPAVAEIVAPALADAGVTLTIAPLTQPQGEGYDLIVSEGATATRPDAWIAALRDGGRLVTVERTGPVGQAVLYVKGREGVSRRELFNAAPPILDETRAAPAFAL